MLPLTNISSKSFLEEAKNVKPDTSQNLSVVKIAKQYIDANAFLWKGDPVTSYADNGVPSDFKLRYWKTGAHVPLTISEKINYKIEQATEQKEKRKNKLRMCCYEFVFLILQKVGVLTEEQINDVIHIGAASVRACKIAVGNALVAQPEALMGGSWENTREITEENYPSPGDIILAKRGDSKVKHVLISSGFKEFYELEDGKFGKLDLTKSRFAQMHLSSFRWLPLAEVSANVQFFIKQNHSLLASEGLPMYGEQDFRKQIKDSKYSEADAVA